jgi:hypothetical protein
MQTEVQSFLKVANSFWNESTPASRSISELGVLVRDLTRRVRNEAGLFANSDRIKQVWADFCTNVIAAPSKPVRRSLSPLANLQKPYRFALETPEQLIQRKEPSTAIERSTRLFAYKACRAYRYWIAVCFTILVILVLYENLKYVNHIRTFSEIFAQISQRCITSVAMGYRFLEISDHLSELPPISTISEMTGLSQEMATIFRSNFQLLDPAMSDLSEMLHGLNLASEAPSLPNCSHMSLSLLAVFEPRELNSVEQRRCYEQNILAYVRALSLYADWRTVGVQTEFQVNMLDDKRIFGAAVTVLTFGCILLLTVVDRQQHRILQIVRSIRPFDQNRPTRRQSGVLFLGIASLLLWALIVILSVIILVVLEWRIAQASGLMQEQLVQVNLVSDIARNAMISLSLTEFYLMDSEFETSYEERIANRAMVVLNSTLTFTQRGIAPSFADIDPLTHWSTPGSDSFSVLLLDFANMLVGGDFRDTGYRFLTARRLMVFNISILANSTLGAMTAAALLALEEKTSSFWMVSIAFYILVILIWFLIELVHSKRVLWLNGATFILRREMSESPLKRQRLLELIDLKNINILEKLPFPAIVEKSVIIDYNETAVNYLNHSVGQLRGQKFSEFFDLSVCPTPEGKYLQVRKRAAAELNFIRIEDQTAAVNCEETQQRFVERMRCHLTLPFRNLAFLVSARLKTDPEQLARVDTFFHEVEARYATLRIINVGISSFKAIAPDCATAVRCAVDLMHAFAEGICVAVVHGIVAVTGLVERDLVTAVSGSAVKRADCCLVRGNFGCCYVDPEIAGEISGHLGFIIPISDV